MYYFFFVLLEDGPGAGKTQNGTSDNINTSVIWCIQLQSNWSAINIKSESHKVSIPKLMKMSGVVTSGGRHTLIAEKACTAEL